MLIKTKIIPYIGFGLLSIMVFFLLVYTLMEAWFVHSIGGLVILFVLPGVIVSIINEIRAIRKNTQNPVRSKSHVGNFFSVLGGALLTYSLSHDMGLGIIVAACMIGILANLLLPKYEIAIYCGAFVGMSSIELLNNHFEILLAGVIAGLVFILADTVFKGFGGKLGTVALIGTVLAGVSLTRTFVMQPLPDLETILLILLFSVITTPLTYYLNIKRQHGPVMASAVIGLLGGLLLPPIFPANGEVLTVVVVCASFIGMTVKWRCASLGQMILAGLVMGAVIIYSTPLLGGAGGKLGSIAFIAILCVCGYKDLLQGFRRGRVGNNL